jgi:hypothetical protein
MASTIDDRGQNGKGHLARCLRIAFARPQERVNLSLHGKGYVVVTGIEPEGNAGGATRLHVADIDVFTYNSCCTLEFVFVETRNSSAGTFDKVETKPPRVESRIIVAASDRHIQLPLHARNSYGPIESPPDVSAGMRGRNVLTKPVCFVGGTIGNWR